MSVTNVLKLKISISHKFCFIFNISHKLGSICSSPKSRDQFIALATILFTMAGKMSPISLNTLVCGITSQWLTAISKTPLICIPTLKCGLHCNLICKAYLYLLEQVGLESDQFPSWQNITRVPINSRGGLHLKVTFALLRKLSPSLAPLLGMPGSLHRAVKVKLYQSIHNFRMVSVKFGLQIPF